MHAGTVKDAGSSLAARLQSLERSFGATAYTFTIQVSRAVLSWLTQRGPAADS